jgi:hypothetical protein
MFLFFILFKYQFCFYDFVFHFLINRIGFKDKNEIE